MQPNRAIVLTPPGSAAIAVVRLAGPAVTPFLQQHFSRTPKAGRCVHGVLSDGSRVIDDPVIVLLPSDAGADISLHGGAWVVQSLLDLATKNGFEIAKMSDPSAALNAADGDTLLERELATAIPAARTELGLRILLNQIEAWHRFKSGSPSPEEIRDVLADATLTHLLNPPAVAIVGAANVGKSTLANQLFGQERSITADLAGTTRDWVGEIANVNGLPVMLVDTPGLRSTEDVIERAAIERSRSRIEEAQCIVLVLDATRPMEPEQSPLLQAYPDALRVVNKCDQPWAWNEIEASGIHTVATTGSGIETLRQAIADRFGCADIDLHRPRWWTQRQKQLLTAAIDDPERLAEI